MICFKCSGETFATQVATIRQNFRGELLDVKTTVSVCTECGWQTLARGQTDELRRHTANTYRERHGLLASDQIKYIRKLKCQNQAEFARFLGVGEASVKRWESGLVQDKAYDQLIRIKCTRELGVIETRKQWKITLSATGWVRVSYVNLASSFACSTNQKAEPNNNRFILHSDANQSDFWCPKDEPEATSLSSAENEKLALAA